MGNILRFANSTHHCLCREGFLCRLPIVCAAALLRHVGSDKSGRYRVHGNVVRAKLHGEAFG